MAIFQLRVANCTVVQSKSEDADTLVGSCSLIVYNSEGSVHNALWASLSASLGSYPSGANVPVNLMYQDVDVPSPDANHPDGGYIDWSFLLVNTDHPDDPGLRSLIEGVAGSVASKLAATGNIYAILLAGGIDYVKPLLDNLASGCNGMLAAQRWQITAKQLLQFTASGSWEMTENYAGPTPAPLVPCNESQYGVHFEVTVGQGVQVPNVKDLSPNDAGNMLRAAGLVMNVAVTRHGGERPTVIDQTPQAGARIGRNEPVNVTILDGKGVQK